MSLTSVGKLRAIAAIGVASATALLGAVAPAFANSCSSSGCSINLDGHISIVNNWWGVSGSGTSGNQYVWTASGTNWGSVYNWTAGNSQYQVKTYAEAADGWAFNGFNGAPFPIKLNSGGHAYTGTGSVYVYGGSYDTIWDCFYNYSSNPGGANPQAELEVWVTASFSNFGYSYQDTVDGVKYDVNINRSGTWPIITYVPANGYNHGYDIDMMDISRDAVNRGYLGSTMYLLDIDFGTEVYYGDSSFNVGSYYAP